MKDKRCDFCGYPTDDLEQHAYPPDYELGLCPLCRTIFPTDLGSLDPFKDRMYRLALLLANSLIGLGRKED